MGGSKIDIGKIQDELQKEGFDGWLFYDFRRTDNLSLKILQFPEDKLATRRWYYFVPTEGEPRKLVHRIESGALDHVPGKKSSYVSWKELQDSLKRLLKGSGKVAMHYSQNNIIPYISKADAGTVELVRSFGIEVGSAANLIQAFEAVLDPEGIKSHLKASKSVRAIFDRTFEEIRRGINSKEGTDEYKILKFILSEFEKEGMQIEEMPIVAVNENSGNPHYAPTKEKYSRIKKGDIVMLDIFARKHGESSIFADYTWMAYLGSNVPDKLQEVFDIVREARDRAFKFVRDSVAVGREIFGYQVDDVARGYIKQKGYGDYFVHRTGHSIGSELHGNGANMDNLETKDIRKIVPGLVFSIEPGIYLKEFGVRLELNVYIDGKEAKMSGLPIQTEMVKIT